MVYNVSLGWHQPSEGENGGQGMPAAQGIIVKGINTAVSYRLATLEADTLHNTFSFIPFC